jgi:hypothetical protein
MLVKKPSMQSFSSCSRKSEYALVIESHHIIQLRNSGGSLASNLLHIFSTYRASYALAFAVYYSTFPPLDQSRCAQCPSSSVGLAAGHAGPVHAVGPWATPFAYVSPSARGFQDSLPRCV